MLKKAYIFGLAGLIAVIAALNFFAYRHHWYFEFHWFDRVMHTLGGLWVASTALWYRFFRLSPSAAVKKSQVLLTAFGAIAIIGVGWELFEFSLDTFITFKIHDAANTASDLFFDAVGTMFGVILFLVLYNKVYSEIENRKINK